MHWFAYFSEWGPDFPCTVLIFTLGGMNHRLWKWYFDYREFFFFLPGKIAPYHADFNFIIQQQQKPQPPPPKKKKKKKIERHATSPTLVEKMFGACWWLSHSYSFSLVWLWPVCHPSPFATHMASFNFAAAAAVGWTWELSCFLCVPCCCLCSLCASPSLVCPFFFFFYQK